ncbi:MAG: NfeD family protein [Candidatus Hydrogenedentota bacterium]
MGHLFDFHDAGGQGGGHGDHGGGDHGAYGFKGVGSGKVTHSDTTLPTFHFPLFSPLALATFFAAIGGYGLMTSLGFAMSDGSSVTASVIAALITSYAVTYFAWKVMRGSIGTSTIRLEDLVGRTGEVLTSIPAGGVGEIAVRTGTERYLGLAREESGGEIARGAGVTVKELSGTTLIVSETKHENQRGGS